MPQPAGLTRRSALALLGAGAGLAASPHVAGAALSRGSAGERAIVARLDAYIDRAIRDDDFSGAVMIARGDRILFARATGLASRDYGAPNRIDTRFNIAS